MRRLLRPLLGLLALACVGPRAVGAEDNLNKFAAEKKLRLETEQALAALRPAVDQAAARWRTELLGRVKTRNGQPVAESTLFAEIRRATETTSGAGPGIEALWQDLLRDRIDRRGFGDQLDDIFSQAIITSWDIHLSEARHRLGLMQTLLDAESAPLRRQWTQAVADISAREGLTGAQRQQLIAEASRPIREKEQRLLNDAQALLDATARQLAGARQSLLNRVTPRAAAAEQAQRPGAPQRLTGLIAAHFESDATGASGVGSSLDSFLASAQLNFAAIVVRERTTSLGLAERLQPLLATRLAAKSTALFQTERPPSPPRIAYVTVLDRGKDPATGATTRILGILGLSLIDSGPPAVSGDADRAYEVIATRGGVLGVADSEPHAAAWQALADRVGARLLPSDANMARLLDAVLVRVRLPSGLLPGLESIRVAGAEAIWPLDAPTTRATLAFIRQMPWTPLANDFDRPQEIFLQSEFAVQVETEHPMRAGSLEIALIGPEGEFALEDAAGQRHTRLTATRIEQLPLLVRTAPIHLFPVGMAVPVEKRTPGHFYGWMRLRDTLVATIVGRPFDDGGAATTVDAALVLGTPAHIPTVDGKGMLFFEALFDAARIHKIELADVDLTAPPVIDSITHTYIVQGRRAQIRFTLTDHAAMLALKRAFIAMTGRVLASHREVLTSEARIRAYIPEMKRIMEHGARLASDTGTTKVFPLGYLAPIRILSDKGLTAFGKQAIRGNALTPLVNAFADAGPYTHNAIYEDPQEAAIFRHAATRLALETQIAGLEQAIAYARDCDDDDVEELLELVGAGFAPIIAEIMPRLLRSELDPQIGLQRWVPDRMARLAVRQLAITLQEHLTAKKAAKADTDAVLALLTATGLGLAEGVAAKVVLAIASAASVGVAGLDIANLHLSRAEAQFAANAVEIIGEDRLVTDTARLDLSATPYAMLAISLVGLKLDFSDAAKAIQLSTARRATETSLARIADRGLDALRTMPTQERAMAGALMTEARSLRAAGKPLAPAQQHALRAADRLWSALPDHAALPGLRPFDPKPALHPIPDDFTATVVLEPGPVPRPAGNPLPDNSPTFRNPAPDNSPTIRNPAPDNSPTIRNPVPDESPTVVIGGGGARQPRAPPSPSPGSRYMPNEQIPRNMPLPGNQLTDLVEPPYRSGHLVEDYRLGYAYGAGAYATTYDLLHASGRPSGRVIKFLRQPFEETGKWKERLKGLAPGEKAVRAPWDETALTDVIDRIMAGQKALDNAKIPHLKVAAAEEGLSIAGRNARIPFIVQDVLPEDAVIMAGKNLSQGQQEALALLNRQIADANLIWLDGHLGNVYFKPVGSGWEAGVLDPDMIVAFDAPIANEFLRRKIGQGFAAPSMRGMNSLNARIEWFDPNVVFGPNVAREATGSSHEFMAKMFEYHGFIRYDEVFPDELVAGGPAFKFHGAALDPAIVRRVFGDLERYVKVR